MPVNSSRPPKGAAVSHSEAAVLQQVQHPVGDIDGMNLDLPESQRAFSHVFSVASAACREVQHVAQR